MKQLKPKVMTAEDYIQERENLKAMVSMSKKVLVIAALVVAAFVLGTLSGCQVIIVKTDVHQLRIDPNIGDSILSSVKPKCTRYNPCRIAAGDTVTGLA